MGSRQDTPPRRWLGRLALAAAALLALVAVTLAVVLTNLDRPWLKTRIVRLVRQNAGVELDYRALRVRPFSGLWLDDLVISAPEGGRR